MGFFGYSLQAKAAPQPRWKGAAPDVTDAIAAVADVLEVWREVALWPDAPPFAGGVWTDWPARLARGLALCKSEARAVVDYLQHGEVKRG